MFKYWSFLIVFLFTVLTGSCADFRFVQVDNTMFSQSDEKSIIKLNNTVDKINKLRDVEFVVFSGNNIKKPNKNELEGFLKIANQLDAPYYLILGNKDINKRKEFGKSEYLKVVSKKNKAHKKIQFANYVIEKRGLIFVVVDGSKEFISTSIGYYNPQTLEWLDKILTKYENKNVVILQHFPIIPPSNRETHYTFKPEQYLNLLSKHNNVKAVVSGHFNVNKEVDVAGIKHISTKDAPSYRIIDIIDYETDRPAFWSIIKD